METAIIVALIGSTVAVVTSFISGVYSYMQNRKRNFIDVVTSERMKWMGALREDVAEFLGLAYKQVEEESFLTNHQVSNWLALRTAAAKVRLRLNPLEQDAPYDKRMLKVLDQVMAPSSERCMVADIDGFIIGFELDAQAYLKIEWERVKLEAGTGRLSPNSWKKRRSVLLRELESMPSRTQYNQETTETDYL